jgi:lysophospholipase L1-like esterase
MTTISRPFALSISAVVAAFAAGTGIFAFAETPDSFASRSAIGGTVACHAPAELTRLDYPLAHTAHRLAAGQRVKIVAIGSSSTAGAGASSPRASYPSRLEAELQQRFPHQRITVLNRGANGEEARDMLARLDSDVIAEKPDLVIWQLGTNSVLRDQPLQPASTFLHRGLARLKAAGADIVLIDPQFAPKVLAKAAVDDMVDLIATTAKQQHVDLFHRFAVMRHWRQVAGIPYEAFLSADELHMNDWSYDCIAQLLTHAIADAATRATLTATTAPAR